MKIALCHEWLTTYGGSEQVAQRIAGALRIRDVYAFTIEPGMGERLFPRERVRVAHPVGKLSLVRHRWQWFLPIMPLVWKQLDLSEYDLIVTSSHSCVNSINSRGAPVVSYCHTPIRYAWEYKTESGRVPKVARPFLPFIAAGLRKSDVRRARNVSRFIANSKNVARRIATYYGRDADVVYPPVDLSFWTPNAATDREDFFLCAGRLVAYKKVDVAITAARAAGAPIVIAGSGPEFARLRNHSHQDVSFVRNPSNAELRDLYRRTRALVVPGVEDFGMTLVEAQACGAPVIALGAGGALETVLHDRTGVLYEDPSPSGLADVMRTFDATRFSAESMRTHVKRFAPDIFDDAIRSIVGAVLDEA